ncbi:MAG: cytochrome c5 [Comamonadaceae bacterium]|nr:MAG: cytochrome c5 [Comamonadaceae bacterium]
MQVISVNKTSLTLISLCVLALSASNTLAADKTGRQVVEQVCAACHATGQNGAPKIGDVAAWSQHAKKGLVKLTENAISGFGNMPAHGGQASLNDLEISRAIAFMVSSGKAADPSKPYASPVSNTGEQLVQAHCTNCHTEGLAGAPRINQFSDWKPRLEKGMDGLVNSTITGHKAMPARTGMASLSDTDLRNAVTYMVIQSATYKAK